MKKRLFSATLVAILLGVLGLHAQTTGNLLTNPGAELGTGANPGTVTGWTPGGDSNPGRDDGTAESSPALLPHSGSYDFFGNIGSAGTLDQTINLLTAGLTPAQLIGATANFDFFEQSWNQGVTGGDTGAVKLIFLDATNAVLGTLDSGEFYHTGSWLEVSGSSAIPLGTVSIDYQMYFTRHNGSYLDAFIDDNSLTVTTAAVPEPGTSALCVIGGVGLLLLGQGFRRSVRLA